MKMIDDLKKECLEMDLKQAVGIVLDYAEENNIDINTAAARLDYDIKSGARSDLTREELSETRKYILGDYKRIVEERKNEV